MADGLAQARTATLRDQELAFEQRGEGKAALAAYQSALALDWRNLEIIILLGNLYKRLRLPDAARRTYQVALAVSQGCIEVHFNLAPLSRRRGFFMGRTLDNTMTSPSEKNRAPVDSYNCSEIPGFESLRAQNGLKELMQEDNPEKEGFVEQAAEMIKKFIFQSRPYRNTEKGLLDKLLQEGYTYRDISLALAHAWLDDKSEFCLPRRNKLAWIAGDGMIAMLSIMLALGSVVAVIIAFRKTNPEVVSYALWLEPLLAFGSTICAIVYFRLLRRIFSIFR